MARITVEDCLEKVANRFILVLIAARRARELSIHNAPSELEWENDKPTVLALREIAAGLVDESILHKTTAIIGHRPVRNPIEMLPSFPGNDDL